MREIDRYVNLQDNIILLLAGNKVDLKDGRAVSRNAAEVKCVYMILVYICTNNDALLVSATTVLGRFCTI